jgi:hypothetical protein
MNRPLKLIAMVAAIAMLSAFSSLSQTADGWGIQGEKVVRYDAKVVDILCELSGDGTLWPVVNNNDPFAGAVDDLIEYCGKKITTDGLEIHNAKMKIFQ